MALKDSDLIVLAKLKGQDHLAAIAARPSLSPAVSDAIIEHAGEDVLLRLVRNEDAEFSREGFETLTEKAERAVTLQHPLVSRADLPPDLMNAMFFSVSGELKRVIVERMQGIDPALIDSAIRQTERRMRS